MMELERREWKQTVGQSGMTPTAFAFLIPVFVLVVFCPCKTHPLFPKQCHGERSFANTT